MSVGPVDRSVINAEPTKEFFISMLVRDIELSRAIADLVDNCIDGARRIRPNHDYQGLAVTIELNPTGFAITDNCGGIDVETARNYAFRFGRALDMPATPNSIGQFGVGMKRALFKLGRGFRIESRSATAQFVVDVSVDDWKLLPDWHFRFSDLQEDLPELPPEQCSTRVQASELHEPVSREFELENFRNQLKLRLQRDNQYSLHQGLTMTLNGLPLEAQLSSLMWADGLEPAYRVLPPFGEEGEPPVTVRLYAGISESRPAAAGWYLFCNGRLVLDADKTNVTGWGHLGRNAVPNYHNQFARFRGYAFFDCEDAGRLPWNTTKTNVDVDSPIYKSARVQMVNLMRPVISFLNDLDREKDLPDADKVLTPLVAQATSISLTAIAESEAFVFPAPTKSLDQPKMGRITYHRPLQQIERVRQALRVTSQREVGEKTFDYFYDAELGG